MATETENHDLVHHSAPAAFSDPPGSSVWQPTSGWYLSCKIYVDFIFALALFVLTLPVMAVAALLVKLTSRGPAFYWQTRIGRNGKPFILYKLRTMRHDCESLTGAQWCKPGDPRITPLGRFLRKTHIDELPQLWNVLRGEMSLVGPRPERPEFIPQLEQVIPHYRDRLLVRPGVTGLAQVQLPPDTDMESVRRKLAYDLYYVRRLGLWLDLRILLCTVLYVSGVSVNTLSRTLLVPRREVVHRNYEAVAALADPPAVRRQPVCAQT
jgi:lipopolysaccharide/colanic/teichoic acid biosynthesis glycosyltransferase